MQVIPFDPDYEPPPTGNTPDQRHFLKILEKKVLWLSTWMIHHANNIREGDGELKVGGHQASCASMVTIMTALYFSVLKPEDRVAIQPHGSPVFHAIQYLYGKQDKDHLARFRALGGAQSYPSRTKDIDDVDFSTGSVGLGVAMTSFAALIQDYLEAHSSDHIPVPSCRVHQTLPSHARDHCLHGTALPHQQTLIDRRVL